MANASARRDSSPSCALLQDPLGVHVLLGTFVVCVLLIGYLLIGYLLTVTLVQPPWIEPVTNWLRTALAWPQLFIVTRVAVRLLRTQQPDAATWCWLALGVVFSTVGITTWALANQCVYPHRLPYPSLPNFFFFLQDLCFLFALVLVCARGRWLPSLRTLIDGCCG